jgi:uncharacterized protein YbjT (DUF2867 family)
LYVFSHLLIIQLQPTDFVQAPQGFNTAAGAEEKQGKDLVDAALGNGIEYFVYSSVERGGNEKSWTNPTDVPHFISKHNIELYLREKAGDKMTWTILRPTAFMDNCTDNFFGKVFDTTWKTQLPSKPLQLIAVKDIGGFAALCFTSPQEWNGKGVAMAGADLTYEDANAAFKKVTGRANMPETFGFLPTAFLWMVKDLALMFKYFKEEGYATDIPALKAAYPALLSWEEFLETASDWKQTK